MSTAKSKAPTKSELRAKITALRPDTKIPSKATVGQLSEMLVSFEQTVVVAKPKTRRRSSKEELRSLFEANGCVTNDDIDAIARQLGVKRESVQTALSDLQNPKWAKGPVLKVEKDGGNYRLSA